MNPQHIYLKLLMFCHLIFFSNHFSSAQGFELVFGGPGTQICNGITLGPDSTIYMIGFTNQGALGGTDFMLSKVSMSGQLLWTRNLGTIHDDFGLSVILSSDSTLVLAGNTHDPILNEQILIIVTDTSGIETSRYTYGSSGSENINSAKPCPDGGYLLAGYQTSSGSNYAYVLKLDSMFNTQWTGSYSGGINDYASEAIMTGNNSFYIASDRRFNNAGGIFDYDISVIKADSVGSVIWDSVYQDAFQNGSQGLFQSQAGNLIFYGETEIYQFSPFDYFISSVDTNGNLLWRYTFGGIGSNALFDVIEDASGNFIGAGYGNSLTNGVDPINLSIVKFDPGGNLIWQREYGDQSIDIGYRILAAPDGGYLVAGRTSSSNDDDFFLVKVDDNGLTDVGEELFSDNGMLSVYPNPVSDYFFVKSSVNFTILKLFDSLGRLVFTSNPVWSQGNYIRTEIPDLPAGIYLLQISDSVHVKAKSILIKN